MTQDDGGNWKPVAGNREWYRSQGNQRILTEDRWKTPRRIIGEQENKLRRPGKPKVHPADGNYQNVVRGKKMTPIDPD